METVVIQGLVYILDLVENVYKFILIGSEG